MFEKLIEIIVSGQGLYKVLYQCAACKEEYRMSSKGRKYGDCVDLNTLTDTWYIYPEPEKCLFAVTKMNP